MALFLVCLSDSRPDILAGTHETTADIWCYDIEAEHAGAAVAPALERWRADVGDRVAISLSVSRMSPTG